MLNTILGIKNHQTQTFTEDGMRIPVTVFSVGPCWVTAISQSEQKPSIQLGFGTRKTLTKPEEGHIKKAGITEKPRFLRQFPLDDLGDLKPGMPIKVEDFFHIGDAIQVTGISKGKGFAGVMKRHGFHGGPATHGQSDRARAPGSIGQTTTPGRVYRGKRMAGRMGGDTVTQRGLRIVAIDPEHQTMTVKGLVPGGKHSFVVIRKR